MSHAKKLLRQPVCIDSLPSICHTKSMNIIVKQILSIIVLVILGLVAPSMVYADHSWGDYHWARTSNPFTVKVGKNVSSAWLPYLTTTATDWSASSVLEMPIVIGGSNPRTCRPIAGRVEVCNAKYGNNGWLGIAQIWINGNHIIQGTTKVNDTYFSTTKYNTAAWRNLVMCQEVGHTLGLDHQDEIFDNANLGSCMDYTSNPGTNQHPNGHDYEELESIYAHFDSVTTLKQSLFAGNPNQGTFDSPQEWGRQLKRGDRTALFERNIGVDRKVFTFVIYAE